MSTILKLRGARALSEFRIAKLQSALGAGIRSISAEFWHFVEIERPLDAAEARVLERLLEYGAGPHAELASRSRFLVVPRIGTISPWSSKASDIARICGLTVVRRIERGTMYALDAELGPEERMRVAALLHDRMTESVLARPEEADALFRRFEPRPLARVPLAALEEANRTLGPVRPRRSAWCCPS